MLYLLEYQEVYSKIPNCKYQNNKTKVKRQFSNLIGRHVGIRLFFSPGSESRTRKRSTPKAVQKHEIEHFRYRSVNFNCKPRLTMKSESVPTTKNYIHIYRVPKCIYPRRNWDSPTHSPTSEFAPPPEPGGGGPRAGG